MAPVKEDSMVMKELQVGGLISGTRTGRPAFFQAIVNAKMGGWFNASKSYVDLSATGGVTGLLSAHNMELRLPSTVDVNGHLTVAEHELVCQASTTVNGNISMGWYQVAGDATALADFLDKGAMFEFTGFTEGDGNIISKGTGGGAPTVAGTIRIMVDGSPEYLCLASKAAID